MTADEFDKSFYRLVGEGHKVQDAFWLVNEVCFEATGKYKYSDYTSYRVSKHKRLKRRLR